MDFNPNNTIVQLCLQGMSLEEGGRPEEAKLIFLKAWDEATTDFEKFLAAFYMARQQDNAMDRIRFTETALQLAHTLNDEAVMAALPLLYSDLAKVYEESGDLQNAKKIYELVVLYKAEPSDKGPFYHGTRAALAIGDLLIAGTLSNYKAGLTMNHIYFTALADGAGLAAALAKGEGPERVYIVEPTGPFENDPNVTNKKFPGNPTRSYRSEAPLKIVGEVEDWVRTTPEQLQKWRERLANNKGEIIN